MTSAPSTSSQEGDTFGEQALVDGIGARTATVTALERVETLALDREASELLRLEHPGVDRLLLMVVSVRLQLTSRRLLDALFLPAVARGQIDVRDPDALWRHAGLRH